MAEELCGICEESCNDFEAWMDHRVDRHAEPEDSALEEWYHRHPDERPEAPESAEELNV